MASPEMAAQESGSATAQLSPVTARSCPPLVFVGTAVYASICAGLAIRYSRRMLMGITSDNGENHLVQTKPSYEEAVRLAGYFDSDRQYLGGTASWNDWTEGEFSCEIASSNGAFCQQWSTFRHIGDQDDQSIRGTCTCSSPEADHISEAQQQYCAAWSCEETRRQESCDDCEENYYTMCECNNFEEDGEPALCQDLACSQGSDLTSLSESKSTAMASSSVTATTECGDDNASSLAGDTQNTSMVAPSSFQLAEQDFTLYFTCSQMSDPVSPWCTHWRGITNKYVGPVIEELCECAGTKDSGYCAGWSCTTYHMRECDVCWVNRGGFLGVLVMACYTPLAALSVLSPSAYRCLAMATAPWAVSAACTMAAYIGGVEAVLQRVLPSIFFLLFGTGWLSKNARSARIQPYLGPFLRGQHEQLDRAVKSQRPMMDQGGGVAGGGSPHPLSIGASGGFSPSRETQDQRHQQHQQQMQIYQGSTTPNGGTQPHPSSTEGYGYGRPLMMNQMQQPEQQQTLPLGSPWNTNNNNNISSYEGGGFEGGNTSPNGGGFSYTNGSTSPSPGSGFNADRARAQDDYGTTPVFRTGIHGGIDYR